MSAHTHQSTQPNSVKRVLADEAATSLLASTLASVVRAGTVIYLRGDLGAGKTTFVRALLRACGETGPVKSPTYTLVEVHPISGIDFYHFDFYRFNQPEEYLEAGLDEYFSGQGICLVEWPDNAQPYLAPADLDISLYVEPDGQTRHVTLRSFTPEGASCLTAVNSCASLPPA